MKNIIWEITMEEKNNKEKIAEESVQSNENTVAEEANNKELEINKEETTVEQESAEVEKIVETAEQKEAAESTKEGEIKKHFIKTFNYIYKMERFVIF